MAVVLPFDTDRFRTRLAGAGLVDHADCQRVRLFVGNELAASSEHVIMVPLDRLEESLQSSRRDALLQSNRLDVLSLQFRE